MLLLDFLVSGEFLIDLFVELLKSLNKIVDLFFLKAYKRVLSRKFVFVELILRV